MNLSQSHNLKLQLSQKLALTNEMMQSLELMQLPIIDLKNRIETELQENPALELAEGDKEQKLAEDIDYYTDTPANSSETHGENSDNDFDRNGVSEFDQFGDSYGNSSSDGYDERPVSAAGDDDSKRQFLEGAFSRDGDLHDELAWQLHLSDISEEERKLGDTIISLIDEDGFFKEDIGEIFGDKSDAAQSVLELIQTFDPPGVASRGIQDALLYQVESLSESKINKYAYIILKEHFDLMVHRKDKKIAELLNISLEQVKDAFDFLSDFAPYPGRSETNETTNYIIPDIMVYRKEGELFVELNNDILPSLTINSYMKQIVEDAKRKKRNNEEQKYIAQKVHDANNFIHFIKHREDSLFKLAMVVVDHQKDFFYKGPKALKPFTMREAAEIIGLSESTVSRLSSSKYMQTDWGLHDIKYFFTNSIGSSGSSAAVSSESVREMIKEILEVNKGKRLSDQKISDILKNRGINIARRTVAKYRNKLDILPSNKRNL